MLDLEAVRQRLLGAWSLAAWQIATDGDREPGLPFGADAIGLLLYTADGWMNASIARSGRAALSAASIRRVPLAEQGAAFESYFNYGGAFTLREIDGAAHVVHTVCFSLNPGFVGTEQIRRIRFDGADRLTLSADEPAAGGMRRHRLDWRRAAANP